VGIKKQFEGMDPSLHAGHFVKTNYTSRCHPEPGPELDSGSTDFRVSEILNQACPEEMPKQVRHDTFSVQNDILKILLTRILFTGVETHEIRLQNDKN
jgi:hypothetical protein